MTTKIKFVVLAAAMLSTAGIASPVLAASQARGAFQSQQSTTIGSDVRAQELGGRGAGNTVQPLINGFPAQQWQQDAPHTFVGGA